MPGLILCLSTCQEYAIVLVSTTFLPEHIKSINMHVINKYMLQKQENTLQSCNNGSKHATFKNNNHHIIFNFIILNF